VLSARVAKYEIQLAAEKEERSVGRENEDNNMQYMSQDEDIDYNGGGI
jgi:hypothetical protein